MDTAEGLFATKGIDSTSLNEIVKLANANSAAIHYHFGSKQGLLDAILERGVAAWNEERENRLAVLEGQTRLKLRDVVEAMVLPTTLMWESETGRNYSRFLGAMSVHPDYSQQILDATDHHTTRMLALLERATPNLSRPVRLRRYVLASEFVYHALSIADGPLQLWMDRRKVRRSGSFSDELVDFLTGAMAAPESKGKDRT